MREASPPSSEVDLLLENARLRDALEPFLDDSLNVLDVRRLPTEEENEFLESMLDWERAPVEPISRWFEPELQLPTPESLTDEQLHGVLWETLKQLYDKRVIIEFTDHLSDRQLYCLICRDILPSPEKKLASRKSFLHWHGLDLDHDIDLWLRYYATDEERQQWAAETLAPLPPPQAPPFPRRMPRRPM